MSLANVQEGSGIGLALVKSLVDMHEGNISVKSEFGKGSKFIVRLPVKILDSEEYTDTNMDNRTKQSQIEGLRIELSDT